jgi:DNA ligase (NAD+)
MDIEGGGEVLVKQLVASGLVRRRGGSLFTHLDQLMTLERMGEKSAQNFLDGVTASKSRDLWRVLFGLGILHVGAGRGEKSGAQFCSMENLAGGEVSTNSRIPTDVGEVIAQSLFRVVWRQQKPPTDRAAAASPVVNMQSSAYQPSAPAGVFAGQNICANGNVADLESVKKAAARIEAMGGKSLRAA